MTCCNRDALPTCQQVSGEPTLADHIFDAIRVTWVAIIGCILFFNNLEIGHIFVIGGWPGPAGPGSLAKPF